MSDPIEEWLVAAGFEPDVLETESASGDDPWADAVIAPAALTTAQRGFVDASSPALGAVLGHDLLGSRPLTGEDEDELAWADDTVIDFDDDRPDDT